MKIFTLLKLEDKIKVIEIIFKVYVTILKILAIIPAIYLIGLVMLSLPLFCINTKNIILGRYKNNHTLN